MSNQHVDPEAEVRGFSDSSFGDILNEFEQSQHQTETDGAGRDAVVVAVSGESVLFDVGLKIEGVIPLTEFQDSSGNTSIKPGDKVLVSIAGRTPEGYYRLSKIRVEQPKDWSGLERAFNEKRNVAGTVTGVVKGGLTVDVGARAFMPASRSGARDAAEMEALIGQQIACRVIKVDVADEDVVVDRRVVLEEEEAKAKEERFASLKEGDTIRGTVRTLMDYGAFVDVGGVDGLLHVGDLSWGRVNKPSDVLKVGDQVDVQVLKVDAGKRRVSLGMKQLQPHPWTLAGEKYNVGDRVHGVVTRTADFGAFIELEPGIEGLIHLSEMSWTKRVRKAGDVVKQGEAVEVVILGVNPNERRISLGLKQALGDPWEDAEKKYAPGTVVEAPVISLAKFGAFVKVAEGVEGMIHVGDITSEKRINHPQDVLKSGETVRAQVLEIDREKRRMRLGIKQLQPTSVDEYISEHKEGDVVTGRVADVSRGRAKVELGEGVHGVWSLKKDERQAAESAESKVDLSSLSSMLSAKWKGGGASATGRDEVRSGQIRSFRIVRLDPAEKKIDLELAS
jgi:small subunit ribosomal protein S1